MKVSDLKLSKHFAIKADDKVSKISAKFGHYRSVFVLYGKKPVGIITPVDLVKKVIMKNKDPKKVLAKQIMSKPVKTASLDDDPKKISALMTKKGYLTMPVVDKKKNIVGVITVYDLMNKKSK